MSTDVVKVRQATPDDAEPIARVHVASWRAAYRGSVPDRLLDSLDVTERSRVWAGVLANEESSCFVGVEHGQIVGFIHTCACRDSDRDPSCTGEITSIYFSPDYWRQGHGTVLLRKGMDALKAHGASSVVLWVFEGNVSARAFYEALGFNADGARKTHARSSLARHTDHIEGWLDQGADVGDKLLSKRYYQNTPVENACPRKYIFVGYHFEAA